MDYHIVSTGARMFDACHAYGLGLLLACSTQQAVTLTTEDTGYRLASSTEQIPECTVERILDLLVLPAVTSLPETFDVKEQPSGAIGNLDGLLTVSFTTSGPRLLSVLDVQNKKKLDETVAHKAIAKASSLVERLIAYAARHDQRTEGGLTALLAKYASSQPVSSVFKGKGSSGDLSIPMTIDPILGFSTRQALSDGRITENKNLAVQGNPLAGLLAVIGATRFLRAQRCASGLVNIYLLLPHELNVTATTTLPLLENTPLSVEQALARYWLTHLEEQADRKWQALACHTLQTQGAQQSITRDLVYLDYAWLVGLKQRAGKAALSFWYTNIQKTREKVFYDIDPLLEFLLRRSASAWQQHLVDVADVLVHNPDARLRRYTIDEVKGIFNHMEPFEHQNVPLRIVLSNERGTRRFGHALRQLGRYHRTALRECEADLDAVRDVDQLLRVLAQMIQSCVVLKAKSNFIIIPDDEDLEGLLADVDRFGARQVASILLILAVLNYPRDDSAPEADLVADLEKALMENEQQEELPQ